MVFFFLTNLVSIDLGKLLCEKDLNARLTRFFQYNTTGRFLALLNEVSSQKILDVVPAPPSKDTHCISHFLTHYIFIRFPNHPPSHITSRTFSFSPQNPRIEILSRSSKKLNNNTIFSSIPSQPTSSRTTINHKQRNSFHKNTFQNHRLPVKMPVVSRSFLSS